MCAVQRVGQLLVETYRIERMIAEGSMGTVFEARHVRIPKRFAVKFLRLGLQENPEALQRFHREAEVVASLEHRNIVGIFDYNVGDDGVPYIVMEYLDGEHLAARLGREGKLRLPEALRIGGAVASALEAAHARDIIHRDLKPENIMLCSDGAVKVVDFGVAKLRGGRELTVVNTVVGTVPYMAPEQLIGAKMDPRVDQYALATILYEMLSGEMAFSGEGPLQKVARRVLTEKPPFVSGIPQAANEVLFRGMARAAEDRFDSVAGLMHALEAAAREPLLAIGPLEDALGIGGEATSVTPEAAPRRSSRQMPILDPSPTEPTQLAPTGDPATITDVRPSFPEPPTLVPGPYAGPWASSLERTIRSEARGSSLRWALIGLFIGLLVAGLAALLGR
jgi:serine/threonine-protein kinase